MDRPMSKRVRIIGVVLGVLTLTLLLLWPLNGGPFADATTRQVMMMGNAFGPTTLTINVGDRVTWVNHDQVPHDATTTNAPVSFRSPMMEQGDTWMYQFTTPGTYEYYCSIHPSMRAKIIVKAAAEPEPEPSEPRTSAPAPPPKEEPKPQPRPTSKAPEPDKDDEPESKAPSGKGKKVTPTATAAAVARPAAQPTARAAPVAAPVASPAATAQPVAAVTTQVTTLNPLLLVAGLVTAVLVFALLVLSSRPQ
jgi:plastocyanin